MSENSKFWIGIGSSFIIPLITYSYMQGRTDSSIDKLSSNVDSMQSQVDELTKTMYKVKGDTEGNSMILQRLDGNIGSVITQTNNQAIELSALKTEVKELKRNAENKKFQSDD